MRQFRFVSNRTAKNSKGEETGNIKVLVRTGSETAETKYKCPECLFEEQTELPWVRPFLVTCSKCKFKIKMPKLKEEMKREKDQAKKKKQEELMEKMKSADPEL